MTKTQRQLIVLAAMNVGFTILLFVGGMQPWWAMPFVLPGTVVGLWLIGVAFRILIIALPAWIKTGRYDNWRGLFLDWHDYGGDY